MQILNNAEEVQVIGGGETTSFSIAMNGKAFRVLSDTLYKNKIGSIVRELSCNAYDAHVMNGNADEPFLVHLPDNFEPWFAVKDFGIGLSPSDIKTVFTKYFESTKTGNNDTIGAFGLGAKTPFSYTDQFTITSVKDGVCSIYSAYITASGVPDITLMLAQPSDERTGVEIKMSVKINDFFTFRQEVLSQLQYFKVKPVIENVEVSFPKEQDFSYESDNVKVSNFGSGHVIIQGNVGYPLEANNLRGKISVDSFSFLESLNRMHLRINFPIGSIGVTASREGIEYNEFTCNNIDQHLVLVSAEIKKFINDQLSHFSTDWEKIAFINKNAVFGVRTTLAAANIKIANSVNHNQVFADISSVVYDIDPVTKRSVRKIDMKLCSKMSRSMNVYGHTFALDKNLAFVIVDKSSMISKKIEHLYSENPNLNTIYRLNTWKPDTDFAKLKQELFEALGQFPNILLASEIALPESVKAERKKSKVTRYYFWPARSYLEHSISNWNKVTDEEVEEISTRVAYVVVKNARIVSENDLEAFKMYSFVKSFHKVLDIVAIRETSLEDAQDNQNMISLPEYIEQVKNEIIALPDTEQLYKKYFFYQSMRVATSDKLKILPVLLDKAPKLVLTRVLNVCQNAINEHQKISAEQYAVIEARANFCGVATKVQKEVTDRINLYRDFYQKELAKYPLVDVYSDLGYASKQKITPEHLAKYVLAMSKVN